MSRTVCEHGHPEEGWGVCPECEAAAAKWHPMTKQIVDLKARVKDLETERDLYRLRCQQFDAEVNRYRSALEEIQGLTSVSGYSKTYRIADQALNPKP